MSENCTFIGAYDGECDDESIRGAAGGADADNCIGLAIMQEGFFKYMYLCDLKVSAAARGRGIGMKLIERAKELAREKFSLRRCRLSCPCSFGCARGCCPVPASCSSWQADCSPCWLSPC